MGAPGRGLGEALALETVEGQDLLGCCSRGLVGQRGAEDPGLAGPLTPHCPSSSPSPPHPHAGPPLRTFAFPSITSPSRDSAPFHLLCHPSLAEPPRRAGQGGRPPFHNKKAEAQDIQAMLARRWQSCYCKPRLWTPSPVLIRFHPQPPFLSSPTAAPAPLSHRLHSFSLSSSLILCFFELSASRALWRKGKGCPGGERWGSRAGS